MIENFFACIDASDLAQHLQEQQDIETAQLEHMREWKDRLALMDRNKRYKEKNRPRLRHKEAKRRFKKLNGVAPVLTPEQDKQILRFYERAAEKQFWSKEPYDVHHIVPLCGRDDGSNEQNVCGLHVPWNLEIITHEENLRIGSKFESKVGFKSSVKHVDDGDMIPF